MRTSSSPPPAHGPAVLAIAGLVAGLACGSAPAPSGAAAPLGLRDKDERAVAPFAVPAGDAALAGARCAGAAPGAGCKCRGGRDSEETAPPAEGQKRFEIRMSADGGKAELESETLGRLTAAGGRELCFYVDLPAGGRGGFRFVATADDESQGVDPVLSVAEYGPTGAYWYDVLHVKCRGASGRCDRPGADEWRDGLRARQRGRLDPCGSAVITNLGWDTTGGQHERDGGLFRDFTVGFAMEVKAFATRFAPGSTECVPK